MAKAVNVDPRAKPAAAAPAQPDPRDAAIARLERTVAEERQNATSLREANDALKFKLQILEKSYAKQLGDARKKMEHVTSELASHQSRLADLGPGGEETLKLLAAARAELNGLKADYGALKDQLARGGSRAGPAGSFGRGHDDSVDTSSTINALIMTPVAKPGRERAAGGDSSAGQQVRAEEAVGIDLLSPDLIFTKKDEDDER
jgi:hypothetical protein